MSNQYFENNPNLKSDIKILNHYYYNHLLKIKTDSGIFSKNSIDQATILLLKNINVTKNIKTILDVGCGCGVIGISLASDNPGAFVDMVDVNLRAIELTNENIMENNIKNASAFESNCYQKITKKYDMIVTNTPIRAGKEIVHKIASEAKEHLNDKGFFYAVVQKKQGADSFKKKLEEVYGNVEIVNKDSGYIIFKSIKY